MIDFLIEGFNRYNVQVVYMNNKYRVLSCGVKNGVAVVRVHKMFKGGSKRIIDAIIGYYTDLQKNEEYIEAIKDYLNRYYENKDYEIKGPNEKFKRALINNIKPLNGKSSSNEEYIEYEIHSIKATDMSGESKIIDKGDIIQPNSDDVMELDIVVKPLPTYRKEVK